MTANRTRPDPNSFDAGSFGTLRYDFTSFGGVTGIIPDPSDEMIDTFTKRYREMLQNYGVDDDIDPGDTESVQVALEATEGLDVAQQQREMADLFAGLCGNSPDAEQILKLPFRVRGRFFTWVQRTLSDPESSAADSTNSRVRKIGG